MLSLVAQFVLLAWTTLGVGLLVRRGLGNGPLVAGAASLAALAGACTLAAALPALFLLGLPRAAALAAAYVAAAGGWLAGGRHALRRPTRVDVATALLLLVPLAGPLCAALTAPLVADDAVLAWWPKVVEVARGQWPELHTATLLHNNPGYPRGMAWLTNLACPWAAPTPATMQMVAWSWTWGAALAMAAYTRELGHARAGALLAGSLVLLPDLARHSGLGMADGAIGAAILLAAIGLASRHRRGDGEALAIAAAIGAPSLKEEGKLVLLVVGAFLLADAVRQRAGRRACVQLGAMALLLVPFWWAKASGGQGATRLDVLPALLHDPDMLVARVAAVAEHLLRAATNGPSWSGLVGGVALLGLAVRGWPRPVTPWPALVFLPVACLVYAATGAPVGWHIATTFDRLMFEMLPTLLLAAGLRVVVQPPTGATIDHKAGVTDSTPLGASGSNTTHCVNTDKPT
jgi:hypothetical protein